MSFGELSNKRQAKIIDQIGAEALKVTKRLKIGSGLEVHSVFMAISIISKTDGTMHVLSGGKTPEEPSDFYRRLLIMHSRAEQKAMNVDDDDD
jgi:hypothetical protein